MNLHFSFHLLQVSLLILALSSPLAVGVCNTWEFETAARASQAPTAASAFSLPRTPTWLGSQERGKRFPLFWRILWMFVIIGLLENGFEIAWIELLESVSFHLATGRLSGDQLTCTHQWGRTVLRPPSEWKVLHQWITVSCPGWLWPGCLRKETDSSCLEIVLSSLLRINISGKCVQKSLRS